MIYTQWWARLFTIVDQFRRSFFNDRRSCNYFDRRSWISIVLLYKCMNSGLLHEPLMIHAVLASTHPFTPSYQYIYIYKYIPEFIEVNEVYITTPEQSETNSDEFYVIDDNGPSTSKSTVEI